MCSLVPHNCLKASTKLIQSKNKVYIRGHGFDACILQSSFRVFLLHIMTKKVTTHRSFNLSNEIKINMKWLRFNNKLLSWFLMMFIILIRQLKASRQNVISIEHNASFFFQNNISNFLCDSFKLNYCPNLYTIGINVVFGSFWTLGWSCNEFNYGLLISNELEIILVMYISNMIFVVVDYSDKETKRLEVKTM